MMRQLHSVLTQPSTACDVAISPANGPQHVRAEHSSEASAVSMEGTPLAGSATETRSRSVFVLVTKTSHGEVAASSAQPNGSPQHAHSPRGKAREAARPDKGGSEDAAVKARAVLGVDVRLWLICVYAFLIAINNTSLRPVLPSFVKVTTAPDRRLPHIAVRTLCSALPAGSKLLRDLQGLSLNEPQLSSYAISQAYSGP